MESKQPYTAVIFDLFGVLFKENTEDPIPEGIALMRWFFEHEYPLYVLSNIQEKKLAHLKILYPEIFSCFKEIITPKQAQYQKPDKRIFLYTLAHLKRTASTILFIDDMQENIISATTVGLHTLWCPTPHILHTFLQKLLSA